MANKIQLRRDTASNWTRINPILADGEPGLDIDNNKIKLGDGTTQWAGLPYLSSPEHNRLVNGSSVLTLASNGRVTVPGVLALPGGHTIANNSTKLDLNATGGIELVTDRGTVQFGVNLEAPGLPTHFHINKTSSFDLFLGDDNNYVKLPALSGLELQASEDGVGQAKWTMDALGKLTLPTNGVVRSTGGTNGAAKDISNIAVNSGDGYKVTVTTTLDHGFINGDKVSFSGITTTTGLNNNLYYIRVGDTANVFILYTDPLLTTPVDGGNLAAYSSTGNRNVTVANTNIAVGTGPWSGSDTFIQLFGNQSYLEVPQSTDFSINPTVDFAVSFWVNQSSYNSNTRLFAFNSWPHEKLSMSSEGPTNLYLWRNDVLTSVGGLLLDTWNYVVVTRVSNTLKVVINGTILYDQFDNTDLYLTGTYPLTIGNEWYHDAGVVGFMRDFKFDVGQGITDFTVPTGPATANTFTKVLINGDGTTDDSSNSVLVGGGGTVIPKLPGSDVIVRTESSGGSDGGNVVLTSNLATWRFDKNGQVAYQYNNTTKATTGQKTVLVNQLDVDNGIVLTDVASVILVMADPNFNSSGNVNINLPTSDIPLGTRLTVISNYGGGDVNLYLSEIGQGPWVNILNGQNRDYILMEEPGFGKLWWETNSYSW